LDSELLAKCRRGDAEAIETLVNEHQAGVYRLCLSILDDADDAQDATQESFVAALKALAGFRGDAAFNTWLFSIAINTCRALLRQRQRRARLHEQLVDPSMPDKESKQSPERSLIEHERSQALWGAISRLDEKHRLTIVLRYYHDLSTQQIAEVLGINVGTVHSRLSAARSQLTGELKRANLGFSQEQEGQP